MTPERIEELERHASEAKRLGGFASIHMAAGEVLALLDIAKAAIPSGKVAEDVALIQRELAEGGSDYSPHLAALAHLAAQAQSAHEWFAKWEQAETLLREMRMERDAIKAPACKGEPDCGWHNGGPCKACKGSAGWTARDDFAKAAMQALLTSPYRHGMWQDTAERAYSMADAMQAERAK